MPSQLAIAVSASVFALGKPGADGLLTIQVTPDGEFTPSDGREMGVPAWRMNAANAQRVIALAAARKTPLVIDYEHQTLHKERNGQPAPAAAWFQSFEYRPGAGLFATAKLTRRAAQAIADEELAYFSPVFSYDAQGNVVEVLMGGFTNTPAIDGMQALAAAAAQLLSLKEDNTVDEFLATLRTTLGLADDAGADDAVAAISKLKDDKTAAETAVAVATAKLPDPAKFVPVEALNQLQGQVAALTQQQTDREVDALVQQAEGQVDGKVKITAATAAWFTDFAKKDLEGARTWLKDAPVMTALSRMQTSGITPPKTGDSPIDDPVKVAALARKYQDEQAAAGIVVSTAAAVTHVTKQQGV